MKRTIALLALLVSAHQSFSDTRWYGTGSQTDTGGNTIAVDVAVTKDGNEYTWESMNLHHERPGVPSPLRGIIDGPVMVADNTATWIPPASADVYHRDYYRLSELTLGGFAMRAQAFAWSQDEIALELSVSSGGNINGWGFCCNGPFTVVMHETSPGDYDSDGVVQFSDFVLLAENFGSVRPTREAFQSPMWADGNGNLDNRVDFDDFVILAENFGVNSRAATAAVPEPSGLLLFSLGLLCLRRLI